MNHGELVIFGEVLFDCFPDGKQVLGGAPFNVAWHLRAFGQEPRFVSRVGHDAEGAAVRAAMQDWGMTTETLQTDPELPTGRVKVEIVDDEPRYEILHPAAFDAIDAESALSALPRPIGLLYHGSLALRDPASLDALERIRALESGIVFVDVNLRPPWWQRQRVAGLARASDWVKLNRHELNEICPSPEEGQAAKFMSDNKLKGLLLTHGEDGAELFTAAGTLDRIRPDGNVEIVDTVGAGDAFTAVFILGLVSGWPHDLTLSRAQAFASAVCAHRGATTRDPGFYRPFLKDWSKE